jgi:uncharacterized protein (TIGR00369 family)
MAFSIQILQTMEARSVNFSKTTITELMIPAYANFGGKIHGGILLSLMDKVAYACAAKHAGNYCVTVSVDGVEFLHPVEVGQLVSLHASVNYVGRTSLLIGIRVVAEDVRTGKVSHTNTSYFTMVAKDETGKPAQVPPLIVETKEQARRFLEAIKRKQLKAQYKIELDNERTAIQVDEDMHLFDDERVVVSFSE